MTTKTSAIGCSDDSECDAIVAAALALIDEAYASDRPQRTATRRRDELQGLRAQIAELEDILAHWRGACNYGPLDGSSRTALWAHVAENQRRERHNVVGENAVLRQCVETQQAAADQLRRALERMLAHLRPFASRSSRPARSLGTSHSSASLSHRLEMIARVASRGWIGLFPQLATEFRDRHATCTRNRLELQYRHANYVPFKLSLVVSVLWAILLQQTFGSEAPLSISAHSPNQAFGQQVFELSGSPATPMKVQGSSGVRRVFTSDGSVVIAAALSATGFPDKFRTNLVDGLAMHEASWLRVGRVPMAPSLVYIESICVIEVHPVEDSSDVTLQLEQVRDTMLEEVVRIGTSNVQKLENRLLDATSRSCCV